MARVKLPTFPGDERSNPYCPNHRSHPWTYRPENGSEDYYDPGWRAVRFVETYCRHTKGRWRGRRFVLFPFQLALFLTVFGTVDDEGLRVIRTVFVEWARKNGKSEIAAAIVLQGLFGDGEQGAEVYGAAYDQEQAGLVYTVAADMVELEPRLVRRARVLRSRKRILVPQTGSFYWAIPADAVGAHGFNASRIVFDEIHTQADRELYDTLDESVGTREQPLLFGITTAGSDRQTLVGQLHDYAEKVAKRVVVDPSFHADVRNPPDDVDFRDRRFWKIGNPALGDRKAIAAGKAFRSLEELEQKILVAENELSKQNSVKRFYLNLWTNSVTAAIDVGHWDAGAGTVRREDLVGLEATAGLDLAQRTDLAAWVLRIPDPDDPDRVFLLPRFWIPKAETDNYEQRDKVPYSGWIREGFLAGTEPGNVIDYDWIRDGIEQDAEDFDIVSVGFDPWGSAEMQSDRKSVV